MAKYVKAREFLQCQYCPKSFSTKRGLKSHTTKAHKKLAVSCSIKTTTDVTVPAPDDAVHETMNSSTHELGSYSIEAFSENLDIVYDKVVFMRQNLFKIPSGGPSKDFVREISRLLSAWNSKSNLQLIAWKCIMVMPTLLLQKPSASSKSRDHKAALQRRLILWQKGDLKELLKECETLQKRLKDTLPSRSIEAISKKFSNLMKKGKTKAAIKLLSSNMQGGVLPLNEETKKLLLEKHPEPSPISHEALVESIAEEIHPVVFDEIDGELI